MTSVQSQSAISRKELTEGSVIANQSNLTHIPRIPPIPIPIPPIHSLTKWPPTQSQSLSPNVLQPPHKQPSSPSHPLHSQSLSPSAVLPTRDRKRLRESSVDDNKDTKRRKLSGVDASPSSATHNGGGTGSSYDVPPPSALMYNRPPSISADHKDNSGAGALHSAASNCSSISRTSPSITSSEPNQTQLSQTSINTAVSSAAHTSANDNNKEIHLALQNLASLVAKNNTDVVRKHSGGVALSSLLSTPHGLNHLGPLLPTQQTQNNVLSMSQHQAMSQHHAKYKTLGLRIPNIDINSMNPMMNAHGSQDGGHSIASTERINQFIFGGTPPVNHANEAQNRYQDNNYAPRDRPNNNNNNNSAMTNSSSHSPLPQPLQSQLLVGMNAMNGTISMNDIDSELQKEMNKREMRKIITHQLEALRQQIYQQGREDEAKLQALKFMKFMQTTTQSKQENQLPLNYTAATHSIRNMNPPQHPHPTLVVKSPSQPQLQPQPPLPLPQFLQIPRFHATNVRPSNPKAMFLSQEQKIISQNKTRSAITPVLSGYNGEKSASGAGAESKASLPVMSDSNEWNAVSQSDEFKRKSKYAGHGRETIIAATGKIQPRKDMDESQCALLCNLMVELCFTEGLDSSKGGKGSCDSKDSIKKAKFNANNGLKIDPEICLKMNLNTNTRMNGFSSMIGVQPQENESHKRRNHNRSNGNNDTMFSLVPPTFQQTSTTSNSAMPGLETELMNHNLSSSSGSDSSSSSSSEDEYVDKFKSDSEDEPIASTTSIEATRTGMGDSIRMLLKNEKVENDEQNVDINMRMDENKKNENENEREKGAEEAVI